MKLQRAHRFDRGFLLFPRLFPDNVQTSVGYSPLENKEEYVIKN